jgi:ribonuclease P protein component
VTRSSLSPNPGPGDPAAAAAAVSALRGRSSFRALESGRRIGRGPLVLQVRFHGGPTRIGYAIPTAVGTAVVRNRIRRRLRAVVAQLVRQQAPLPAADVLVKVRPGVAGWSFPMLSATLTLLLREAATSAASSPAPASPRPHP